LSAFSDLPFGYVAVLGWFAVLFWYILDSRHDWQLLMFLGAYTVLFMLFQALITKKNVTLEEISE
jgi:hypothetical protein